MTVKNDERLRSNAGEDMKLGLGIDTGGTFTDSVILDLENGRVLGKAKALTTREDLAIGIKNSLSMLNSEELRQVRLVSLSSTLATNSVVEGKGCRVALILIGMEQREAMPVDHCVEVAGGHNLNGIEQTDLDKLKVDEFIDAVQGRVDAFAVSGLLSVRNPAHELAVKDLIRSKCSLPVVCGHELSSQLGFYERTITAVLNAKLIPIISDLIAAVTKVLAENGITAPLMIVKGDGTLMSEAMAEQRPVETVLSGPAASILGAMYLTKEKEAVIVDVGGTTTDIGIMRNGRPRLDPEGALIGGWRTRVKAVDIMTSGIGGDSRIIVKHDAFILSPLRVVPLCVASRKYPEIIKKLEDMSANVPRQRVRYYDVNLIPQLVEFFVFSKEVKGFQLSPIDKALIDAIKKGPKNIFEIAELTGIDPFTYSIRHLEELGMVARIGLTPTDILHAMGTYTQFDRRASELAVAIQSKAMSVSATDFCKMVRQGTIDKIANEVLMKLIQEDSDLPADNDLSRHIIKQLISREVGTDFSLNLNLNKKIIGIGAPVSAYLPEVAGKFNTGLLLPENSEVGNAVGAITGTIMETVEILIKPRSGMSNTENPPSILFSSKGRQDFPTLEQAKLFAIELASKEATDRAMFAGAEQIELVIEVKDDHGNVGNSYGGGGILLGSKVMVTAISKPKMS
jgi:N-methylhydantoinase A/oxoprolinase/acetone carboxylase beta subunit